MSPELLEIERKAIRLTAEEREILAEGLLQGAEGLPLTEVEETWVNEAERRFKAWRRGERKGVSARRAFRQKIGFNPPLFSK